MNGMLPEPLLAASGQPTCADGDGWAPEDSSGSCLGGDWQQEPSGTWREATQTRQHGHAARAGVQSQASPPPRQQLGAGASSRRRQQPMQQSPPGRRGAGQPRGESRRSSFIPAAAPAQEPSGCASSCAVPRGWRQEAASSCAGAHAPDPRQRQQAPGSPAILRVPSPAKAARRNQQPPTRGSGGAVGKARRAGPLLAGGRVRGRARAAGAGEGQASEPAGLRRVVVTAQS
jgi:hypothetical protein